MAEKQADIALVGLAVMGQNIILNMDDHGFTVCAYNRTTSKVDDFLNNEAKGTKIVGAHSLEEMVSKLKTPRRVMLLVKAGAPVDAFIDALLPLLQRDDIIIDGGNSNYEDTNRRHEALAAKGIRFVGAGVSGGETGARYGPSLMPGGAVDAWPHLKDIFQSIAAKADGEACCEWVGPAGSGHFVKMVHNGIEYGDMQLIAEAYHLLLTVGCTHDEMATIFDEWNKTELDSYLIEITAEILRARDEKDGEPLVTKIRDAAGQKGTGKWTGIAALQYGVPVTLIGEAVFARCLSSLKSERAAASAHVKGAGVESASTVVPDRAAFVDALRQALYAAKIVSYAQGFMLMREASEEYKWKLNYGGVALMWRGGCIIRSRFLGDIKRAFDRQPDLVNLLLDDFFAKAVNAAQPAYRTVSVAAVRLGVPTPAFSSALAFLDGYRSERLPANIIQAQRDYFGAHTYERLDAPGKFVHTDWTGSGGRVTSNAYNA